MRTTLRTFAVLALLAAAFAAPGSAAGKTSRHHKPKPVPRATRGSAGGQLDGGATYVASPVGPATKSAASAKPAADGGTTVAAPQGASGPAGSTGPAAPVAASGGATEPAGSTGSSGSTGSTGSPVAPTVAGPWAKILASGLAVAPADAPAAVKQAIAAGNQLIGEPYVYGGGHLSFVSDGYDCSGTVSYALHGGGLLAAPLDSSALELWGTPGVGTWITVYTNPVHAYVDIAGIRLDTSTAGDPGGKSGPRWRPLLSSNKGFFARHFQGL
jgi:cell wall-associated NlpC family hydrolase